MFSVDPFFHNVDRHADSQIRIASDWGELRGVAATDDAEILGVGCVAWSCSIEPEPRGEDGEADAAAGRINRSFVTELAVEGADGDPAVTYGQSRCGVPQ